MADKNPASCDISEAAAEALAKLTPENLGKVTPTKTTVRADLGEQNLQGPLQDIRNLQANQAAIERSDVAESNKIKAQLDEMSRDTTKIPENSPKETFMRNIVGASEKRYIRSLSEEQYVPFREEVRSVFGGAVARQVEQEWKVQKFATINEKLDALQKTRGIDVTKMKNEFDDMQRALASRSDGLLNRDDLALMDRMEKYAALNGELPTAKARLREITTQFFTEKKKPTAQQDVALGNKLTKEQQTIKDAFFDDYLNDLKTDTRTGKPSLIYKEYEQAGLANKIKTWDDVTRAKTETALGQRVQTEARLAYNDINAMTRLDSATKNRMLETLSTWKNQPFTKGASIQAINDLRDRAGAIVDPIERNLARAEQILNSPDADKLFETAKSNLQSDIITRQPADKLANDIQKAEEQITKGLKTPIASMTPTQRLKYEELIRREHGAEAGTDVWKEIQNQQDIEAALDAVKTKAEATQLLTEKDVTADTKRLMKEKIDADTMDNEAKKLVERAKAEKATLETFDETKVTDVGQAAADLRAKGGPSAETEGMKRLGNYRGEQFYHDILSGKINLKTPMDKATEEWVNAALTRIAAGKGTIEDVSRLQKLGEGINDIGQKAIKDFAETISRAGPGFQPNSLLKTALTLGGAIAISQVLLAIINKWVLDPVTGVGPAFNKLYLDALVQMKMMTGGKGDITAMIFGFFTPDERTGRTGLDDMLDARDAFLWMEHRLDWTGDWISGMYKLFFYSMSAAYYKDAHGMEELYRQLDLGVQAGILVKCDPSEAGCSRIGYRAANKTELTDFYKKNPAIYFQTVMNAKNPKELLELIDLQDSGLPGKKSIYTFDQLKLMYDHGEITDAYNLPAKLLGCLKNPNSCPGAVTPPMKPLTPEQPPAAAEVTIDTPTIDNIVRGQETTADITKNSDTVALVNGDIHKGGFKALDKLSGNKGTPLTEIANSYQLSPSAQEAVRQEFFVNNQHKVKEYLDWATGRGMSLADAITWMSADIKGSIPKNFEGLETDQIKGLVINDQTGKSALAVFAGMDQDALITSGWLKDKDIGNDIANAYNQKNQFNGNIQLLDSVFDPKQVLKADYLKTRIDGGDKDAFQYIQKISAGTDENKKIELVDTIIDAGKKDELVKIPGGTDLKTAYFAHYQDPTTALNEKLFDVSQVSTYGTAEWYDGLGQKHTFNTSEGNKLYDPSTGKYDIAYTPVNTGDPYHPAVWAPDPKAYFENVIAGGMTGKQATDWVNAVDKNAPSQHANWICEGSGCTPAPAAEAGEGKGGGGGGSMSASGGKGTTGAAAGGTNTLFIDTGDIADAEVWANNVMVGKSLTDITMPIGKYDVVIKKQGYRDKALGQIAIGNYPVTKTANMIKLQVGVDTFLKALGGVGRLTTDHILYVYCIAKEGLTGDSTWRVLANSLTLTPPIPLMIERPYKYDALYLYYKLTGQTDLANKLVQEGRVVLSEPEEKML